MNFCRRSANGTNKASGASQPVVGRGPSATPGILISEGASSHENASHGSRRNVSNVFGRGCHRNQLQWQLPADRGLAISAQMNMGRAIPARLQGSATRNRKASRHNYLAEAPIPRAQRRSRGVSIFTARAKWVAERILAWPEGCCRGDGPKNARRLIIG